MCQEWLIMEKGLKNRGPPGHVPSGGREEHSRAHPDQSSEAQSRPGLQGASPTSECRRVKPAPQKKRGVTHQTLVPRSNRTTSVQNWVLNQCYQRAPVFVLGVWAALGSAA